MALTDIALARRGLMKVGARTINSFTDGSTEAILADSLYDTTRDALLSAYPWRFATAQAELSASVSLPEADYSAAFDLPSDFLRALSVGSGGRGAGVRYRIMGDELHCGSETAVLTYIFRPDETDFPPFFDKVLIAHLAAEFCLPLSEDAQRAELLARQAENAFNQARRIDAQQDSPRHFEDFPLINARG